MNTLIKNAVKAFLRRFDLALVNKGYLDYLVRTHVRPEDLRRIAALPEAHTERLLELLPKSKSQLRQDLFVLSQLNFMEHGYFVEFGAANGLADSNTHLLEYEFGWTGILAEPARCWHEALRRNRGMSRIDTRCVWRASGETLNFNEVEIAALSTIASYTSSDGHAPTRMRGKTYEVETVSLQDLLEAHRAPREIDYLSVDTEGSEFEILDHFDFDRYRFKVISCEHNFTPQRPLLQALLSSKGYVRTLESISSVDDWYFHRDLVR